MKKVFSIYLLLALLLISHLSFAANTGISGMDAFNLRIPTDGSGTYSIVGSKALKQWQPHFGLTAGYNWHMISARRLGQRIWPVKYAFSGDFVAALGLFDFLSLGAEVPFSIYEKITNVNTSREFGEAELGDIRFAIKGRLLEDKGLQPGIAIIPSIFVPTGDVNNFTGNTGLRYQGLLVIDKDFGPLYLSINGGYRFVNKKTVIGTIIDDQILYGLGLSVPIPVWNRSLEFFAEGTGSSVVRNFSSNTTSFEAIGGFRKTFENGLRVDLAGSAGIIKSLGTPNFRVLAGIGYTMPKRKKRPAKRLLKISETMNFASDSFEVNPKYYPVLISIGKELVDNRKNQVAVDGYTDSLGFPKYNQAISQKRADEVKTYLIYFGAENSQIEAIGHGDKDPIAPNDTKDGRAKNRRVLINRGP